MFSFLCPLIWSERNYITICLHNKDFDFIFVLNQLIIYSLPTAMSSVTGNHTINLFYLLKEYFKNLLFDLLITGRRFKNLCYLSNCHKDKDSEEYARTYCETLNQTLLTQKYFRCNSPYKMVSYKNY